MVNLQTELLAKSAPLFQGSSTFAIKRSQTTSVQVTLSPVVSAIPIPDSFPTITAIGDSSRLQCAALFATRDTIHGLSPSWSSLDPQVLRVSVSGVAVAITEGEAHVRAAVGNTSATLRVRVSAIVRSLAIDPRVLTIQAGQEVALQWTARDANSNVLQRSPDFRSSSTSIASVDATGRVRGLNAGRAFITAALPPSADTVPVTVLSEPIASVAITPALATISVGETVQLDAEIRTASGTIVTRPIIWTSSIPTVASVNTTGLVNGLGIGTVAITATADGVSGSATVTVTLPFSLVTSPQVQFSTSPGADPPPQILPITSANDAHRRPEHHHRV